MQSCEAHEGFGPVAAETQEAAIQQALSALSGHVVPIYATVLVRIFQEEHELAKVGLRHADWQLAAKLANVQHPQFSNAWGHKRVLVTKLCNVGARCCVRCPVLKFAVSTPRSPLCMHIPAESSCLHASQQYGFWNQWLRPHTCLQGALALGQLHHWRSLIRSELRYST